MQQCPPARLSWSFTAGVDSDWSVMAPYRLLQVMNLIPDARDPKVTRIHFHLLGIWVRFNDFQEISLPSDLSYSNPDGHTVHSNLGYIV